MTTIGLSYSLVKRSTKCAPALHDAWVLSFVSFNLRQFLHIIAASLLPYPLVVYRGWCFTAAVSRFPSSISEYGDTPKLTQ